MPDFIPPISYLTDDRTIITIKADDPTKDGQARWDAIVQGGPEGVAIMEIDNLTVPLTWTSDRVARHALEVACSVQETPPPCNCPDPDCPGRNPEPARVLFAPNEEPTNATLTGPYFSRDEAVVEVMVRTHGEDAIHPSLRSEGPSVEELVRRLAKTEPTKRKPNDPFNGATWMLG